MESGTNDDITLWWYEALQKCYQNIVRYSTAMVSQDLFKVVDHSSMHDTSTITDYVEPESKFLASDRKNRNV